MAISGWNADADMYTEAEKGSIINSLPPAYRQYETDGQGRLKCPLSTSFVLDDPHIKAAVHQFKNDIKDGYYDKTWQNQARKAMEERRDGKFNAYLQEHTEETFGDSGLEGGDDAAEDSFHPDTYSSDAEWSEKNTAKAAAKNRKRFAA
jgi:hypothetical protein